MRTPPDALSKRPHRPNCNGNLARVLWRGPVYTDVIGRAGNGGWVAYLYECNMSWDGCPAVVYVWEHAVRKLAVAADGGTNGE